MEDLTKYEKHYSDNEFWKKLKVVARKAGLKVVYAALLLVYVVKSPLTSKKDKGKILGALGYFILPIDVIPDWIPVAGYTDDLAALTWAIYSVAKNVTPEVKQQAKAKLKELFGEYDEKDLQGLL
ncbi:MAG: DUF1232 domain-containing protein [Bacteroidales bacterium]|jgi:uncharacterized membrane protein YkvA (DUF1232 family)|nr:DUF1232 domain-containing protein [Bacteroidales bacterium]MBQ9175056.1 DUF1232 domain-containing protein [Bacteroidales bacterium]MBQ9712618.1 DUF1232 domain-containing protein [Bacteroidales bacterium]MBR1433607.1 DUF1232 domain-containing protein [Bacteroidales bacterium]MBR6415027.1 DUF1232 domain-containing protein [Bacteroidales bacterium]